MNDRKLLANGNGAYLVAIVFGLVTGIYGANKAREKNLNPWLWFFIIFLTVGLGLILFAILT